MGHANSVDVFNADVPLPFTWRFRDCAVPTQVVVIDGRRGRKPSAATSPIVDLSTAIPTFDEIANVPTPKSSNLLGYSLNAIEYGLSIHPTTQVLRPTASSGFRLRPFANQQGRASGSHCADVASRGAGSSRET